MNLNGIVNRIGRMIYPPYDEAELSFSQEGEDMVLDAFFKGHGPNENGFYVDIGAHHPFRFSNTYRFYLRGWNGINVDATPGSMVPFQRYRRRDINLECGVGTGNEPMQFFVFDEPALNTFSDTLAQKHDLAGKYKIKNKIQVRIQSLESILNNNLAANKKIDFLSVDVEGQDYDVLRSNNWEKYRPSVVLAEATAQEGMNQIVSFLQSRGYRREASTWRTSFFIDHAAEQIH